MENLPDSREILVPKLPDNALVRDDIEELIDEATDRALAKTVRGYFDELDDITAYIISARVGWNWNQKPMTFVEIAKGLDIHRNRVSTLYNRGIARLFSLSILDARYSSYGSHPQ